MPSRTKGREAPEAERRGAPTTTDSPSAREDVDSRRAPDPVDRRRAPETRERIVRATLALLAAEGTAALSNRRIAGAAAISLGSLTYHFPSQASLLRESLLLYVTEEVERLEAIAAALRERAPSPEEVAAEVEALIGRPSGGPGPLAELELHLQAARDPELQEASARCFAAYDGFAASALRALGVVDPARHASAFVALITGLGVRRLGTGTADGEAATGALLTLLRGALASTTHS
ncbi:MAG TPA: TetR family transcriptional regulator [Solirubrobacterales bacterium]|nr:TetR family transcriptional regulator [Solirubrobacterales bacterium]